MPQRKPALGFEPTDDPLMLSQLSTTDLDDRVLKARAASGAVELMERELGVIAKANALRRFKPEIANIRSAMRALISALERCVAQAESELRRRQESAA